MLSARNKTFGKRQMWAKIVYVPTGPTTKKLFLLALFVSTAAAVIFAFSFFSHLSLFFYFSFILLVCVGVLFFLFSIVGKLIALFAYLNPFRMQGKSWRTAIFYSVHICIYSNTPHNTHTRAHIETCVCTYIHTPTVPILTFTTTNALAFHL